MKGTGNHKQPSAIKVHVKIDFVEVYELVLKSIQEYVGIISTNVKGGYDTKSILNSLRDKEESIITLA